MQQRTLARILNCLVGAMALAIAAPAHAASVTYAFTGAVTTVSDPNNILAGAEIGLADPVAGSFTIDGAAPYDVSGTSEFRSYVLFNVADFGASALSVMVEGVTFAFTPGVTHLFVVDYANPPGSQAFGVTARVGPDGFPLSGFRTQNTVLVIFNDTSPPISLLSDPTLPVIQPLDFASANGLRGEVSVCGTQVCAGTAELEAEWSFGFRIDQIARVTTPEPISSLLFGAGLLGLAAVRRTRAR
jgi:hypothetical protein